MLNVGLVGCCVPFGISSWDGSSLGLGLAVAGTFPLAFPHGMVPVLAWGWLWLVRSLWHFLMDGSSLGLGLAVAGTFPLAFPHGMVPVLAWGWLWLVRSLWHFLMGWFQSWLGAGCGWYVPFGISSWDGSSLGLGLAVAGTFPLAFPHGMVPVLA